jgi:hypothetical protein
MARNTDLALLKALREYERAYAQLSTLRAPASESMRSEVADAVRGIHEELRRRGRTVPLLGTIERREAARDEQGC